MDRNDNFNLHCVEEVSSLSARRAWIEMYGCYSLRHSTSVALRKESVDRNFKRLFGLSEEKEVALRKESVDRNGMEIDGVSYDVCRSPQGERG